ncbi:hypothetical protein [Gorillibacterium sp. CAU 1737]|uniref:hypothetical protein n=1 Tax=Gorillibacterium sp. CAU 1737 TaxID=3140362 RepID=UPI003260F735
MVIIPISILFLAFTFVLLSTRKEVIDTSLTMYDINGIYVNQHMKGQTDTQGRDFKIKIQLTKKNPVLSNPRFEGSITINNVEYVFDHASEGVSNERQLLIFRNKIGTSLLHFDEVLMYTTKDFSTMILVNPDFVLSGPSDSVEDAIKKYQSINLTVE